MDDNMDISIFTLLMLFFAFQFKHYLADFPLQNYYVILGNMLNIKNRTSGKAVASALSVHGLIHGLFTTMIFVVAGILMNEGFLIWLALALGLLDAVIHGLIDALVLFAGRETKYSVTNNSFATLFGFDQFLHHSTYVLLVALFFWSI